MRSGDWALVVLLLAAFVPGFLSMADVWSSVDYYSHGYLVPLVALWAASAQRQILPRLPSERDARGLVGIVLGLGGYLIGLTSSIVWLTGVSMVATLAAGVFFLKGSAWLRALSFSIGYLLFMVPLPDTWLAPVIVRLQLIVSSVGVDILHALGQPIFRDGNVIQLPDGEQLFVAEACSGITSLITLLPLGVFLAYFTEQGFWRRMLLISTVVPAALAGNLVRVLGTVLAALELGTDVAIGSALHDWAGIFTYVLACGALLGLGALMRRYWPPPARVAT
jgi:exosortase